MGKQNQQSWKYNDGSDGTGERITVEYDGGQDGRTAEVTFVCTPGTVASGFTFLQENANSTYEMQISTMYACAATPTMACAPSSSSSTPIIPITTAPPSDAAAFDVGLVAGVLALVVVVVVGVGVLVWWRAKSRRRAVAFDNPLFPSGELD